MAATAASVAIGDRATVHAMADRHAGHVLNALTDRRTTARRALAANGGTAGHVLNTATAALARNAAIAVHVLIGRDVLRFRRKSASIPAECTEMRSWLRSHPSNSRLPSSSFAVESRQFARPSLIKMHS